jgi:hypothetical protein
MTTNTIVTSEPVAGLAVELLTRTLVLPMTTLRVAQSDYRGSGGTVHVRVRTPRLAREQTVPGADIDFDDLEQVSVAVSLTHLYDAALLSDEDVSLNLADFGAEVLEPQIGSIATAAELELGHVMNTIETDDDIEVGEGEGAAYAAVLVARERLTSNLVPLGRRWLACSPSFVTALLGDNRVSAVDASGSSTALRDAVVGRLHGFTVVESPSIDAGAAIAYHESAFASAFLAPARPRGAVSSTQYASGGVAMRHIFQYVPTKLADASVVSVFAGAGAITEDGDTGEDMVRALRITGADISSI